MRASLLRVYLTQIDRMLGTVQRAAEAEDRMRPASLEIALARVHIQQAIIDLPGKAPIAAPVLPAGMDRRRQTAEHKRVR